MIGAILVSGRGSNMAALLDAAARGEVPVRFARVVSDREDVAALALARERGVEAVVVPRAGLTREAHEARLAAAISDADLICLAGYMRVLSPGFVAGRRILNIHPSLLPAHPGLEPQRRTLEAGDREAGCTVHRVTAEVDGGPIVAQARVPVEPGDTVEALSARILAAEHRLYPEAVRMAVAEIARGEAA